jgi:hypothetical protein
METITTKCGTSLKVVKVYLKEEKFFGKSFRLKLKGLE